MSSLPDLILNESFKFKIFSYKTIEALYNYFYKKHDISNKIIFT